MLEHAKHKAADELLSVQQLRLLGRVLRSPATSPLHRAAFVPGTLRPATSRYVRRVGRPRKEWVATVLQTANARNTTGQDLRNVAQSPATWHQTMLR